MLPRLQALTCAIEHLIPVVPVTDTVPLVTVGPTSNKAAQLVGHRCIWASADQPEPTKHDVAREGRRRGRKGGGGYGAEQAPTENLAPDKMQPEYTGCYQVGLTVAS